MLNYGCKIRRQIMFKIFSITFGFCLIAGTALSQLSQPYVRKKIQPNFFIPEGALAESHPEKVGIPQYRKGTSTAKRISSEPAQEPQMVKQQYMSPQNEEKTTSLTSSPITETSQNQIPKPQQNNPAETPLQTNINQNPTDTPNYQKMYQDYLQDLDIIAKNGNIKDSRIADDLNVMNSEKRIQLDQEFNSKRNVKQDILDALKK